MTSLLSAREAIYNLFDFNSSQTQKTWVLLIFIFLASVLVTSLEVK